MQARKLIYRLQAVNGGPSTQGPHHVRSFFESASPNLLTAAPNEWVFDDRCDVIILTNRTVLRKGIERCSSRFHTLVGNAPVNEDLWSSQAETINADVLAFFTT